MRIFLHNYKIGAKSALRIAGYKFREKEDDFIRETPQGRFHAKIIDYKAIDIHYDLYIEWRHVSGFDMPITHNLERKRILRRLWGLRDKEMDPEQWHKLQLRYG